MTLYNIIVKVIIRTMFEKFTERGRKIIIYAKEEAEKRQNDYLGTEHILLAILKEDDGLPIAILKRIGATPEEIRHEIERNLPQGTNLLTFGDIPFTPRAKKVLELAVEEARLLGHNYIGSEHILLGLIRVVQKDAFVEKKMSMAEYNQALLQYENKLGKSVQRTVELETIRANLMRFRKKEERFKQERKRLLDLMKETQKKYLVGGMIETRVYYSKMRSFSTRLSEVEEKIALEEAKRALKKGKAKPKKKVKIDKRKARAERAALRKKKRASMFL